MKRDNGILRMMLMMAWPIMIEEGLQTLVSYVDAAMLGRLGPHASAAVGLTQTPSWLIWGLLRAASIGLIAYVSQSMGAEDYTRTRRAGSQALIFAVAAGAVVTLFSCGVAYQLPGWMGAEADIQPLAGQYFFIISVPVLFRSLTINLGAVIRSTGDTRTPMVVNVIVNVVSILLNYLLIYPTRQVSLLGMNAEIWGAGWGVAGAAVSSALAITLGGVLMVIALYRSPLVSPRGCSLRPDPSIVRYCLRIAIPAGLQHVIICLGFVVCTSLVARLGTISLAAHSNANTAEQAFYIPAYGLQGVAATMIGMAVGAGDEKRADQTLWMLYRVAFFVMAALGLILFLLPEQMMRIFTRDAQVIAQGARVLRIVAVAEPFFGVLTMGEGVLRGVGNMKPTVYIALGCMWGIRVLFTFLSIRVWSLGLTSVWVCMTADNVVRFLCYSTLFKTGRWKKTPDSLNRAA